MIQKKRRLIAVAVRAAAIALILTALSVASYAHYAGRGQLTGTVTEVRTPKNEAVFFWVEVDEQSVTGPRLGDRAMLLYKGKMISDIKPGIKLRIKFDGENEVTRETDVLFVESIEFPDGTVVRGESFDLVPTLGSWKWSEVLYMLAGIILLFTGASYFYKRLQGSAIR